MLFLLLADDMVTMLYLELARFARGAHGLLRSSAIGRVCRFLRFRDLDARKPGQIEHHCHCSARVSIGFACAYVRNGSKADMRAEAQLYELVFMSAREQTPSLCLWR